MRLHVVSLPHSQTTREYDTCAFTAKVRKFADMMTSLSHEVYLYAGDENDAEVTELVICITRQEQRDLGIPGPERVFDASFDIREPQWQLMNARAIEGIEERKQPGDLLCVMAGWNHKPIMDATGLRTVEFGIGYPGSFAPFRVFESFAWMHATYAAQQGLSQADGRFYDVVIPSYFEADAFPMGDGSGGYLLYIGRLTQRKGLAVVKDLAERTGLPLVVAGDGEPEWIPPECTYIGHVNPEQRAKAMGDAIATVVPTLYLEPFGSVACESMMCGTPVLTTDWGAFTETVVQGRDGWRCRTLGEFEWAALHATELDRHVIRANAMARFSTENVRWQYDRYLRKIAALDDVGWYEAATPPMPELIGA
jgi:hypothetical protein